MIIRSNIHVNHGSLKSRKAMRLEWFLFPACLVALETRTALVDSDARVGYRHGISSACGKTACRCLRAGGRDRTASGRRASAGGIAKPEPFSWRDKNDILPEPTCNRISAPSVAVKGRPQAAPKGVALTGAA